MSRWAWLSTTVYRGVVKLTGRPSSRVSVPWVSPLGKLPSSSRDTRSPSLVPPVTVARTARLSPPRSSSGGRRAASEYIRER